MITDRYYGVKVCPRCNKNFVLSTQNYDPKEKYLCPDCKFREAWTKYFERRLKMKKYNVKHYKDFNCIYFDRSSGEYRDCILKAETEKQAKEICENIFGNCWKVVFVK